MELCRADKRFFLQYSYNKCYTSLILHSVIDVIAIHVPEWLIFAKSCAECKTLLSTHFNADEHLNMIWYIWYRIYLSTLNVMILIKWNKIMQLLMTSPHSRVQAGWYKYDVTQHNAQILKTKTISINKRATLDFISIFLEKELRWWCTHPCCKTHGQSQPKSKQRVSVTPSNRQLSHNYFLKIKKKLECFQSRPNW